MPWLKPAPQSVIHAAELARALGGKRAGRGWQAACPAHDDSDPSLSISVSRDGKTLIHCHAGCGQQDVIDALRNRGLWNSGDDQRRIEVVERNDHSDENRTAAALDIWNRSIPAQNTPVETYLRARGITVPTPAALRFHDKLRHHPTGTEWPAMVGLVTDANGAPIAVHRTYLALDGNGKAPVTPNKMTLGPCRGGAVRLSDIRHGKGLAIAEGIETALSVAQASQIPAWAALSAEGMKNIALPLIARAVIVCADHDINGTGQRAAREAADRFLREGRSARITMPPNAGTDFNDLLQKESKSHV